MKPLRAYKEDIPQERGGYWEVPFRQFVDDFRRERDLSAILTPALSDNPTASQFLAARQNCGDTVIGLSVPPVFPSS